MASGYDPVISLLTQIKNSILAGTLSLEVDHSKYRESVLKVLEELGLLRLKVFRYGGRPFKRIHLEISDDPVVRSRLTSFRSYSKPGRRVYWDVSKLKELLGKRKIGLVLSTSRGVLPIESAAKKNLGGEILFEV